MTSASSGTDRSDVELELGADEQLFGAEVLGADVDHAGTRAARPRSRVDDARRSTSGEADSPMSRLFISLARTIAITTEQQADGDRCRRASHAASPVIAARPTPTSAIAEADQRAEVLEQHDRQLGRLRTGG